MKRMEDYLRLNYRTSVYKDEEGDFIVEVDDLPGCVTHGSTVAEAFENLEEAKKVWMESHLAAGLEIPEPKQRDKYSGRILVRMPRSLHRALAEQAEEESVSLNQYIVSLLSMASAWSRGTAVNASLVAFNVPSYRVLWPGQITRPDVWQEGKTHFLARTLLCRWGVSQPLLGNYQEPLEPRSLRLQAVQNEARTLAGGAA